MAGVVSAADGTFTGFPPGALQFFKEIAAHNTKEWYDEHALEYKQSVITPAQAFVTTLGPHLRKLSPGLQWHTDPNGKGSIKKIQTDRRFNPGRTPYKTYLDIMFWEGPLKVRKENSGFYFRLSPDGLSFSAGLKYFERSTLAAYRGAVLDPGRGPELRRIVTKLGRKGYSIGGGDAFKKLPAGVMVDHPQAELFLHDAIYAFQKQPLGPELHSAQLLDVALAQFKVLAPLHRWCVAILS